MTPPRVTPQQAWDEMALGNARFVSGGQQHPHQDAQRRGQLSDGQNPDTALFGCSDSRLAAEIIFDRGLGDLFVIRNMGHIVAESIVASLEFAVAELGCALIIVLAHDSCGAVKAAINLSTDSPAAMPPAVEQTLQPVLPAVQQVWLAENSDTPYVDPAKIDPDRAGRRHLQLTVNTLLHSSVILKDAVAAGKLGIVGLQYALDDGVVHPICAVGPLNIDDLGARNKQDSPRETT
ncbi:carbonic anhydrase [Leucobacter sp. OH1287]|nr:carbonic anhydrase [Leucobacter sp. OH1287]RRD60532.1 carbonic anhydrase [Leucobacter sp. OH1287]